MADLLHAAVFSPSSRFHNADPEMVQCIVRKYQELDRNNDGMLNFTEVAELLRQGDDTMTDREIRGLFNTIDNNGTGRLDLTEFTSFVFDIQPEGTDREKRVEAMQAKAREYEKEVQDVEVFGASLCPELDGTYNIEFGKTLNGRPVLDRAYPQSTIFYGFTEGKKQVGWFCAKKAPAEGKAVIRYKMFNPSPFAATPNLCSACWENSAKQRDKRMVVEANDNEEWDIGNKEGFGRGEEYFGIADEEANAEAEEEQTKFGETYECEEAGGNEEGDWNTEWYDQAGEAMRDAESDEDGAYDGDDAQSDEDVPGDDWTDPDFPPEASSIGAATYGVTGWARLATIHDQACICQVVGPEDVLATDVPSHMWFMSACACIAEYPAWVQSMFGLSKTTKLPGDHQYSLRLYHPGKKSFTKVEFDDFVPTRDGTPVFAEIGFQGEIWCPLIEKAFAKLCKSYKNSGWGSVAYGLLYLCGGGGAESWTKKPRGVWSRSYTKWKGQATDTIDRKRSEGMVTDGVETGQATFWLLLQQYMELCYPVCLTADEVKAKKTGLSVDRAYSLIAVQEVQTDHGILRLLRIRNSWGGKEGMWKGRWSDDSDAWVDCPAAMNACKFKRSDGRTFWMSYNDFLKYFKVVDCVKKSMPIQGCKYSKLALFKDGLSKYGNGY